MVETQKKFNKYHSNWRFYDAMVAIFAIATLAIGIVNFESDVIYLETKYSI